MVSIRKSIISSRLDGRSGGAMDDQAWKQPDETDRTISDGSNERTANALTQYSQHAETDQSECPCRRLGSSLNRQNSCELNTLKVALYPSIVPVVAPNDPSISPLPSVEIRS